MSTKRKKIIKIFILSIIFMALHICTSNAAIHSTDPSGSTDSTVSITVTSTEALENFDLLITDTGGLTYLSVSTSGVPNQSTGAVSYAGLTGLTTLATYTFKTPSTPGNYKVSFSVNGIANNSLITVTSPENTNDDTNNNESNNNNTSNEANNTTDNSSNNETNNTQSNNSNNVETKKSNNANLKNLGITPNDFKGFTPNTTTYNVTIPNNVEEVTVYANVQDSKASLKGTGKKKIEVGKNTLNIVVTAEDGTQKTYTLNVTREENSQNENNTTSENVIAQNTVNEEQINTSNVAADLIKLQVKGYEITPKFSSNTYEYTLNINKDDTELEIITEGANDNVSIETVGNTNIVDGENIITVLVYNEETGNNSTYQIVVNKISVDLTSVNTALNEVTNNANKTRYTLFGVIAFIIIGIIIFIIAKNKYGNNSDDIYEYDEEDRERLGKETLNLDEEETFFKRINKEDFQTAKEEKNIDVKIAEHNADDIKEENSSWESNEENEVFFRATNPKKKGKHF